MRSALPNTPRFRTGVLILAALVIPLTGCGYFRGAVLLWGKEPTRDVPAEYPYLAKKKVCILVWAEPFTLHQYPFVRLDVSEHIRAAMEGTVHGISFVPNAQVIEYQDGHPQWQRERVADIGARFGADRVLLIELTQYTTRDPSAPHLYRGHMAAYVKVYDTAFPDAQPKYKTPLETTYPEESYGEYGTDDQTIRRGMMQAFAAELAGKFYDRKEKVK